MEREYEILKIIDKTCHVDPDNTNCMKITVKTQNPNKVWHELGENVLSKLPFDKIKSEILTESIYKGRLRYNKFELFYPVNDDKAREVNIEVKDKKGLTIFIIGNFSYKIAKERGDAEQRLGM